MPRALRRRALALALASIGALPAAAQYPSATPVESAPRTGSAPTEPATTATQRAATESRLLNRWEASFELRETWTNNVNLEPADIRRSDWVTQLTPGFKAHYLGPHSLLDGFVTVPMLVYARTGDRNNSTYPQANLLGDIDLYENVFHVESQITVAQQFFTPLGARSVDLSNANDNRYRTATYRISPYLKGTTDRGVEYELRNNDVWTNLSGSPIRTENSRYTQFLGHAGSTGRGAFGWRANFDISDVRFNNQSPIRSRLGRLVGVYNVDPSTEITALAGYESNEYSLSSSDNTTYGLGFRWRPTERTDFLGTWEHRFFGSSYALAFSHRTPLSVWSADVSRNITTYPQQLARLQGGVTVSSYLFELYRSIIPDPIVRQDAVDKFIRDRGLPTTLADPINLYSQQILLQTRQSVTAGFIGARNTLFFTLFNVRSQPIDAEGNTLPPLANPTSNNRQAGFETVWTHRLTPASNLVGSYARYQTKDFSAVGDTTSQDIVRMEVTTPVSPRTTAFFGARYQGWRSDVRSLFNYHEAAGFFGLSYLFR